MKLELRNLIINTIKLKYSLPEANIPIDKASISTRNDECYVSESRENLCEIIYNSIIEYSHSKFDLDELDRNTLLSLALEARIRVNDSDSDATQLKYGFFGEVLLHSILYTMYNSRPLIARGIFYNPLSRSETHGYDSYHIIQSDAGTELWFGEVKFYLNSQQAIDNILDNLQKVISDGYMRTNVISLYNHTAQFDIRGSSLEAIINDWRRNPKINIPAEMRIRNIRLIYPIFIVYEMSPSAYDDCIRRTVEYINSRCSSFSGNLSIPFEIFFIFLPIEEVTGTKRQVLEWIKLKRLPI